MCNKRKNCFAVYALSSVFKCLFPIIIRPPALPCISDAGGLVDQAVTKVNICCGFWSTGFLLTEGSIQNSVMGTASNFTMERGEGGRRVLIMESRVGARLSCSVGDTCRCVRPAPPLPPRRHSEHFLTKYTQYFVRFFSALSPNPCLTSDSHSISLLFLQIFTSVSEVLIKN